MRGYRFALEGLPNVVCGGGLELAWAAARDGGSGSGGGGGGGGGGGQDDIGEGSAAAATGAAARCEFVASLGGEGALAASVALLTGCAARGDGDGGEGSKAGAAVLTIGALLGASPLPSPVGARAKRMAACDPDQAPVRASEWELRTPSLAVSGLVAVLVHRRKSHERSYCIAQSQSDDEEVALGFKVERDAQWFADRCEGVNTITRSHYSSDLSVRLEKDGNADADSHSEGPQGGGSVGACLRELQLLNIEVFTHRDSWDTRERDLDVFANVANLKHLRRLFFGPASPSLSSSPAAGQAISLPFFADALFSILSSRPGSFDGDNDYILDEAMENNEDIEEGCAHLVSREAKLFVWQARSEGILPEKDSEEGGEGSMVVDELEGGGGGDDNTPDETAIDMFWGKAGGKAGTSEGSEATVEAEAEATGNDGDTPAPALAAVDCFPFPLALAPALDEDSTAATDGCEEPAAKRNHHGSPQPSDENDEGGGEVDDEEGGEAPSGLRVGCARLCASAGVSVASATVLKMVELLLYQIMHHLVEHFPDKPSYGKEIMDVGGVALAVERYLGQRSETALRLSPYASEVLRLSPYAGEVLDAVLRSGEGNAGGVGATLEGLLRSAPPVHAAVLRARLASASFSAPLGALGALPDAALVACLRHHDPSPLGLPLPSVGVLTLRGSGSDGSGGAVAWGSPQEATAGGLALVAVLRQLHPDHVLGPCAAACLADLLRAFAAHAAAGACRAAARRLSARAGTEEDDEDEDEEDEEDEEEQGATVEGATVKGATVKVTAGDVIRCRALPNGLLKHAESETQKALWRLRLQYGTAEGSFFQRAGLTLALPADLVAQLQESVCGPGMSLSGEALVALGAMVEYVCTTVHGPCNNTSQHTVALTGWLPRHTLSLNPMRVTNMGRTV